MQIPKQQRQEISWNSLDLVKSLKIFDLVAMGMLPSNISEKKWETLEKGSSTYWG